MTRWFLAVALGSLVVAPVACSDDAGTGLTTPECSDGIDNDGDGAIDFPDDPSCDNDNDEESGAASPQCNDGRDNDNDGKIDFPYDPGCSLPNEDQEEDDCPDGPRCPQCSNGVDDDMNGTTDWPDDGLGCAAAGDGDEYTRNPAACGNGVTIKLAPAGGHTGDGKLVTGTSSLSSPTCGGTGAEDVYEIRINSPKVLVASTDAATTTADTVLYLRGSMCQDPASELACSNDISATNKHSSLVYSITTPGTYYLVVDAKDAASTGNYDLTLTTYNGEGVSCATGDDCYPGLVCRIPKNMTAKVCAKHVCEDNDDEDNDGKPGFPTDPGCTSYTDDDETDPCPGAGCPACGDGVDNDTDTLVDYPNDWACVAASGTTERFCAPETDATPVITAMTTTGTTAGKTNNLAATSSSLPGVMGDCSLGSTAPEVTHALVLPVPVQTLQIDSNATTFDTILVVRDVTCGTALYCDDDGGDSVQSLITMTNVQPGAYAISMDGYSTENGAYTLHVRGTVAPMTRCDSPLFSGGANAVLVCPTGTSCTGTPAKCQ
ncbi:MAG: hypothetical protein HOV81_34160 [Kofleriaceae bacterium]|nr:hypothetical protein [Kofleriaceae bacterium]